MTLAAATVAAAVGSRLTGLPTTGARVFNGRNVPLQESDLPCWRVHLGDDAIENQGMQWPVTELHTLQLQADGVLMDLDTLDADMSALAAEGLGALFATVPPYLLRCTAIERAPAQMGERAVGIVTLRLQASYFTRQNDPETIL